MKRLATFVVAVIAVSLVAQAAQASVVGKWKITQRDLLSAKLRDGRRVVLKFTSDPHYRFYRSHKFTGNYVGRWRQSGHSVTIRVPKSTVERQLNKSNQVTGIQYKVLDNLVMTGRQSGNAITDGVIGRIRVTVTQSGKSGTQVRWGHFTGTRVPW
jgi:hypothetical protein